MNKWEEFAQENAEYYILTHENIDFNKEEGQNYFFKSGEQDTKTMLLNVLPLLKNKKNALEIGCGIGRLAFAHARIFQEVYAVDVSETMLNKLNGLALKNSVVNVKTFLPSEEWDREDYFDYIYSFIVFQHIVEFPIIEEYIRRIAKAVSYNGIIQLHFDTRKASLLYKLRRFIPDMILPKSQREGIRRNRRSSEDLKKVFNKYGLQIINELYPDSPGHLFILKHIKNTNY